MVQIREQNAFLLNYILNTHNTLEKFQSNTIQLFVLKFDPHLQCPCIERVLSINVHTWNMHLYQNDKVTYNMVYETSNNIGSRCKVPPPLQLKMHRKKKTKRKEENKTSIQWMAAKKPVIYDKRLSTRAD